ncbi:uncharacterized protein LOC142350681 [Convolutriloba macropyga]|uniref:uncharacterized protein LOC142350681 n=1 Tax=Convolutriloba macropyga TaxID=536237 RepID=UPI003F51C10E
MAANRESRAANINNNDVMETDDSFQSAESLRISSSGSASTGAAQTVHPPLPPPEPNRLSQEQLNKIPNLQNHSSIELQTKSGKEGVSHAGVRIVSEFEKIAKDPKSADNLEEDLMRIAAQLTTYLNGKKRCLRRESLAQAKNLEAKKLSDKWRDVLFSISTFQISGHEIPVTLQSIYENAEKLRSKLNADLSLICERQIQSAKPKPEQPEMPKRRQLLRANTSITIRKASNTLPQITSSITSGHLTSRQQAMKAKEKFDKEEEKKTSSSQRPQWRK